MSKPIYKYGLKKRTIFYLFIGVSCVSLDFISFILLSKASRMTPASNVSIIMLLETILGPLWVWTFTNESPQFLTIIGGTIVILALTYFFSIKSSKAVH